MAQQNADFSQRFVCYQSDGVTAYNVSGTALRMDVKDSPGAVPAATFSTSGGNITIEAAPNTNAFDLYIPAATMAMFKADRYWWDILQLGISGTTTLLGGGYLLITTGITSALTPNLPNYNGNAVLNGNSTTLAVGSPGIVLDLLPSGPIGPQGPSGSNIGNVHATVSASITLDTTAWMWPVSAVSGSVTVAVPFGSGLPNQAFLIKKIDGNFANTVTIQMSGSDTIDGQSSQILTMPFTSYSFSNQGGTSNWYLY